MSELRKNNWITSRSLDNCTHKKYQQRYRNQLFFWYCPACDVKEVIRNTNANIKLNRIEIDMKMRDFMQIVKERRECEQYE